jgi:glutathione S-transferase
MCGGWPSRSGCWVWPSTWTRCRSSAHFDRFAAINPVVKAPSFVTDDGVVLMDSGLMLEHIAHLAPRPLMPPDRASHEVALRQIGLALAACDKSVSILYERTQRPPEKQHQPWLDRVRGQLLAAYGMLEKEVSPDWFTGEDLMQPQITVAVAWRFSQHGVSDVLPAADFPRLSLLSARAEKLPAFQAFTFG